MRAADRLALDQAADGSWPTDGEDAASSPAAYGRPLATFLARQSLFAAGQPRFRTAIERADAWLLSRDVVTVTDASVSLLASAVVQSPAAAARREQSLDLLERGTVRRRWLGAHCRLASRAVRYRARLCWAW